MTPQADGSMRIDLLRHGDTGHIGFRGRLDDALTDTGWRQLVVATGDGSWDAVVASPLRRCADFAREFARATGAALRLDGRLAEYDFGDWSGRDPASLAQADPASLARFWADPEAFPPPGAESLAAFRARIHEALDAIAAAYPHRRVLVVTHGGVIRLLRCEAEGGTPAGMSALDVPHASLHPVAWPLPRASRAAAVETAEAGAKTVEAQAVETQAVETQAVET